MARQTPVDFQTEVIDRSREVPVVVDFKADWCAPCRVLGPVLERLAARASGRWELVVCDTEKQPEIAEAFGIASLPTVMMFRDGQAVSMFQGAIPEDEVVRWIDTHLPDPREAALADLAARWVEEGADLRPALERFHADHPDYPPARLRLAQAHVVEDPARARALLAEGSGDDPDLAEDVTALADLMEHPDDTPGRVGGSLRAAREALRRHAIDDALGHLIEAAMIDKHHADDLPRRGAVALCRLIGRVHPIARKHERRLSMALHS